MSSKQIDDPWWKVSNPADEAGWSASYKEAEQRIRAGGRWRSAFSTIAQSFDGIQGVEGDKLRAMEEVYRGTDSITAKRGTLQTLVHEVFEQPRDEWPDYADAVWHAVTAPQSTASGLDALEGGVGADPLTQATFQATLLLIAGFLEKALPATLGGDQWWDPKFPTGGGLWEDGFIALNVLVRSAPAWKHAFTTFFQELPVATLQAARSAYESHLDEWERREQLWSVVRDQVFGADPDKWPKHVGVVMSVVSEDMMKDAGHVRRLPRASARTPLRIVTFKVVVLFLAAVCEGQLERPRPGY
jgi:hypothetical protein